MLSNFILFTISLISSLIIGKLFIPILKSINAKQTIRKDGPSSHLTKKSQTSTIGGLIFLIPVFFITLVLCLTKKDFLTLDLRVVLCTTFVMATLGFIDDYLKVRKRHNKGVSGWIKLLIQLLVSYSIFHIYKEGACIFCFIWFFFIIAGSSNSYNLTDGLDGLLGSVTLASLLGFFVLFYQTGKFELLTFSVIFFAALIGFLYFNRHPARVFMGDTGSLAIGGAIGSLAIASKAELFLVLFAAIPILEALSVILQVISYQYSKRFLGIDKRLFKMAPLHHHFELIGWKETDIVKRFFIFQVICTLIGILILLKVIFSQALA